MSLHVLAYNMKRVIAIIGEQLPLASRVGKTIVGGTDLNKERMRKVVEAAIALAPLTQWLHRR
jgi:hypothetical protein